MYVDLSKYITERVQYMNSKIKLQNKLLVIIGWKLDIA